MKIPENAVYILNELEHHGYEAYVVGGCVRDMMLGRKPEDWDITTSAKPYEVKSIFQRTIDTGIQHGTVTVMIGKEGYEVTTYRMDGEYEDHRHPKEVLYTPDLLEDLKRRDFTINAMAYNPRTGLVDAFDGMKDLERGCIRCVGIPEERFEEDALRMLRGIRFAGQLQFEVEEATLQAIVKKAPTLVNVSAERIRTELTKLILSAGSDRLLLAFQTGLSQYFLPEFGRMLATGQKNPHHCYDVGHHTIKAVQEIYHICSCNSEKLTKKQKVILAYAALLHDVAKPECKTTDKEGIDHFQGHPERGETMAKEILRRLKFDNETISIVSRLVRYHDRRHENCLWNGEYSQNGKKAMRRLTMQAGKEVMELLFYLQQADLQAQSEYKRGEKLAKLEAGLRCYREINEAGDPVRVKDLALTGKDLIALGMKPGPELGEMLQKLLDIVMDNPKKNTKQELEAIVKEAIVTI